jgi:hypothetical protein
VKKEGTLLFGNSSARSLPAHPSEERERKRDRERERQRERERERERLFRLGPEGEDNKQRGCHYSRYSIIKAVGEFRPRFLLQPSKKPRQQVLKAFLLPFCHGGGGIRGSERNINQDNGTVSIFDPRSSRLLQLELESCCHKNSPKAAKQEFGGHHTMQEFSSRLVILLKSRTAAAANPFLCVAALGTTRSHAVSEPQKPIWHKSIELMLTTSCTKGEKETGQGRTD